MPERSYRSLLLALALVGASLDQGSKYLVFWWLYPSERQLVADRVDNRFAHGEYDLVPGTFKLLTQYDRPETESGVLAWLRTRSGEWLPKVNHGALFGLGDQYAHLANGVFAGVSIVAILAIAYWSTRRSTTRDLFLCSSLGLILAGTIGNLYDRVVFGGVRDFLYFYLIQWPVFNVADCCLVCGAFLLLAQAFWSRSPAADDQQRSQVAMSSAMAEGQS